MAEITQEISEFDDIVLIADVDRTSPSSILAFQQSWQNFNLQLKGTTVGELNTFGSQANELRLEVNGFKNSAETAKTSTETARDKAEDWAEKVGEVEAGKYSAKHWAEYAEETTSTLPMGSISLTPSDTQAYPSNHVDELIAASGSTKTFTATGAGLDGAAVTLNADGTVSIVDGAPTTATNTDTAYSYLQSSHPEVILFDTDRIVFMNPSDINAYLVGLIDGDTITFTSSSLGVYSYACAKFDATRILVATENGTTKYPEIRFGTVNVDNTITFGSPQVVESVANKNVRRIVAMGASTIVCLSSLESNYYLYAIAGSLSDGTFTFGATIAVNSASTGGACDRLGLTNMTTTQAVCCYINSSNYPQGRTINLSGTSITLGALAQPEVLAVSTVQVKKIGTTRFVMGYQASNAKPKFAVGSITGTSVSYGGIVTPAETTLGVPKPFTMAFDGTNLLIMFTAGSSPYTLWFIRGSIATTTITLESAIAVRTGLTDMDTTIGFINTDSTDKYNLIYGLGGAVNKTVHTYLEYEYTNVMDWIGFADGIMTDGNPVNVKLLGGISTKQTGLVVGQKYYVDLDGTLSTVDTGYLSQYVGKALSETELLITYEGE